jgi:predicted glycosyl hydrolase (DUF1957 family)
MLNWVNFLHIYQPPGQEEHIFHQVTRESYCEIAEFFIDFNGLRLTMNLSGALLEQFIAYRYDTLLDSFRRAFESGQLELVGSAMYHPILPLLPHAEIERQILLDEKIKQAVFGPGYVRRGFYLPELAYSRAVAELLERMGFAWILLDEVAYDGQLDGGGRNRAYRIKGLQLKAVLRDRVASNCFVPEMLSQLVQASGAERTLVTATDGELYGHRHKDFYNKTREVFTDSRIRSCQVSDFLSTLTQLPELEPLTCCWESTEEELARGNCFSFWRDDGNHLQAALWEFAQFVRAVLESRQEDEQYALAHSLLDKGLASCHFWAASGRTSAVWKDTIWNPDMIENGNSYLLRAVRSLRQLDRPRRLEAEARSREINRLIWEGHWNKFYHL